MKAEFWLSKWQNNEIGFHLPRPHPWLVNAWPQIQQQFASKTVFVPLCGKTFDIDFLLQQGQNVIGCELSEQAAIEVFYRLGIEPNIMPWQGGFCYQSPRLSIYVGDFFLLSSSELPPIDLTYDRAAIIALPEDMRVKYAQHLVEITNCAPQCLITLEYDQAIMAGPPFSVDEKEVQAHYAKQYEISCVHSADILEHEPKFKQNGLPTLIQGLYLLTPQSKS